MTTPRRASAARSLRTFSPRDTHWRNDLDRDHEATGKPLMTQLTRARWCLDRVPTLGPEEGRRSIQTAQEICEEVARSLAALPAGGEVYTEVQMILDEVRARIRSVDDL